jgi:cation:H+ antiporter
MTLISALLLLFIGLIILAKSADLIVTSVIRLARLLHIKEFIIGFFILGMATSSPEIFIGIKSALSGNTQISLGNLLGGQIFLMTFIIGMNAVINREVYFTQSYNKLDLIVTSLLIVAPTALVFDNYLSRSDGLLLILLYVLFVIFMNRRQIEADQIRDTMVHQHHLGKTFAYFFGGCLALAIGAQLVVDNTQLISLQLGIPMVVIGLIIVSIGTNLPELSVMLTSLHKRHSQLGMGDFLGSAVANTPILGAVVFIHPTYIDIPTKMFFSAAILMFALILLFAFYTSGKKLTRHEGIALLALYSLFLISELLFGN